MGFNRMNNADIETLRSFVDPDRFSAGDSILDLHSIDQSRHTPVRPEAVIWPLHESEVVNILKYANKRLIPVTGWGAGSSLEGNPVPVKKGIVLDFSRMDRIIDIREEDFQADVEPGVIYKKLNKKLRHKGLFFPPDPGADATIGGMIANNSSGIRTIKYGSTRDNLLRLSVVLANGEIIRTGTRASKTSSGYDLKNLITGSEGTLGIVTRATVRLTGIPAEFSSVIATFPSIDAAGKAVFEIIRSGLDPAALELLGSECIRPINFERNMNLSESPTLFIEYHGPSGSYLEEVIEMTKELCMENKFNDFRSDMAREERDSFFSARHELSEMVTRKHPDCSFLSSDVAVPITGYPDIISTTRNEIENNSLTAYIFSHAGDGNLHIKFAGKKGKKSEWELIEKVNDKIVSKALSLEGTATGEHGVGIGKSRFMNDEHGNSLVWMKKIKDLFDPNGILNPGKIFPE
ncbi:FAD-binding oxidoreductase [Thermodesulfobacteriota bacterium]